ncbi:MAG: hypothetical protein KJN67_04985 [Pontiella sp.]|nr:hypothetical protein [Pontiella sp.]
MSDELQNISADDTPPKLRKRSREVRPLTTDERASFAILALYMFIGCISAFVYWDSLTIRILGVTAGSCGMFLFVAAFFNTEGRGRSDSIHPLRSYLISFFSVLCVLFILRFIGGLISNYFVASVVMYIGLIVSLIIFRKAMVQVVTAMLAIIFLFVMIHNWEDVIDGKMGFEDSVRRCGQAVFQIGPIQDVTNMLIAGNYVNYLNQVNYSDPQLNIFATRLVRGCEDETLCKTKAVLDYVSNQIHYVSDPLDGFEHAKDPINTLISTGGDCEDQTLLLCSLLESVGVKTYIAFTDDHVFALVPLEGDYDKLNALPAVYIENEPCYALDPSDPNAVIGRTSANPRQIGRVFNVRRKAIVEFSLTNQR